MSSKHQLNQKGFSVVEGLLIVAVLVVIGFLAMRVIGQNDSSDTAKTSESSETASSDAVPAVTDNADLKEAEDFVKNTDIDSALDTSEIDAALSE